MSVSLGSYLRQRRRRPRPYQNQIGSVYESRHQACTSFMRCRKLFHAHRVGRTMMYFWAEGSKLRQGHDAVYRPKTQGSGACADAMCEVERMHYSSSRVSTKGPTSSPFCAHVLLCDGLVHSLVILATRPLAVRPAPFPRAYCSRARSAAPRSSTSARTASSFQTGRHGVGSEQTPAGA